MSTLEKKIADAVLTRIRARAHSNGDAVDPPDSEQKATKPVSLRVARFSDFEKVYALNRKLGLGPDSAQNWKRLWSENPSIVGGPAPVVGWVLEAAGDIVGFLGSIPVDYEYAGTVLRAAVACRRAVEPSYRPFSHLLITSFFRQKGADLFLNTTATVAAGKMMLAFKASPLPQKDYGKVLFWVIDRRQFSKSVFRRMGISPALTAAGSGLASLGVSADMLIRGRTPRSRAGNFKIIETGIEGIGDKFERFWAAKSTETSRLRAKRTAAIVRWHFDPPNTRQITRVVGCYAADRLVGYGITRHYTASKDGLRRSIIADLMMEGDDPGIGQQLLTGMYQSAKHAGSHVLEVMGFPKEIREMFCTQNPYSRNYPGCPFFYKASDRVLHERLADEDAWYACPFDGDGTIWP